MCDYSLQGLPNRLAFDGEELVTHRFPTGSIGMASAVDIACRVCPQSETTARRPWWLALKRWLALPTELKGLPAICIPPGARLRMSRIPDRLRREFTLDVVEDVTFVQLSAEPFRYRDAIRFTNGRQILLQSVREGVGFTVLASFLDESETDKFGDARSQNAVGSRGADQLDVVANSAALARNPTHTHVFRDL